MSLMAMGAGVTFPAKDQSATRLVVLFDCVIFQWRVGSGPELGEHVIRSRCARHEVHGTCQRIRTIDACRGSLDDFNAPDFLNLDTDIHHERPALTIAPGAGAEQNANLTKAATPTM